MFCQGSLCCAVGVRLLLLLLLLLLLSPSCFCCAAAAAAAEFVMGVPADVAQTTAAFVIVAFWGGA